MSLKSFFLIFLTLSFLEIIFPQTAQSWGSNVHRYMCPENSAFNCLEADDLEFKKTYPFGGNSGHLCLDNKPNCAARLISKYYLKKYYVEGEKDPKLIGAAAHLLQDATCPDHWYPTKSYFGKIFVPFAPNWLTTVEPRADGYLQNEQTNWNIPISFQRKEIGINKNYVDNKKELINKSLTQEPTETLGEIEAQIKSRNIWSFLRSVKEVLALGVIILLPFWGYTFWRWKKHGKGHFDLILISLSLAISIFVPLLVHFFY